MLGQISVSHRLGVTSGLFLCKRKGTQKKSELTIYRKKKENEDWEYEKEFLKKLVTGILAATLGVTALAGCGSAKTADKGDKVYRTLDEIKDSGEINIGVFSDKNPFGYVDDNGDYQGYDVYFADRVGKILG